MRKKTKNELSQVKLNEQRKIRGYLTCMQNANATTQNVNERSRLTRIHQMQLKPREKNE
jgi:hypothetical protein